MWQNDHYCAWPPVLSQATSDDEDRGCVERESASDPYERVRSGGFWLRLFFNGPRQVDDGTLEPSRMRPEIDSNVFFYGGLTLSDDGSKTQMIQFNMVFAAATMKPKVNGDFQVYTIEYYKNSTMVQANEFASVDYRVGTIPVLVSGGSLTDASGNPFVCWCRDMGGGTIKYYRSGVPAPTLMQSAPGNPIKLYARYSVSAYTFMFIADYPYGTARFCSLFGGTVSSPFMPSENSVKYLKIHNGSVTSRTDNMWDHEQGGRTPGAIYVALIPPDSQVNNKPRSFPLNIVQSGDPKKYIFNVTMIGGGGSGRSGQESICTLGWEDGYSNGAIAIVSSIQENPLASNNREAPVRDEQARAGPSTVVHTYVNGTETVHGAVYKDGTMDIDVRISLTGGTDPPTTTRFSITDVTVQQAYSSCVSAIYINNINTNYVQLTGRDFTLDSDGDPVEAAISIAVEPDDTDYPAADITFHVKVIERYEYDNTLAYYPLYTGGAGAAGECEHRTFFSVVGSTSTMWVTLGGGGGYGDGHETRFKYTQGDEYQRAGEIVAAGGSSGKDCSFTVCTIAPGVINNTEATIIPLISNYGEGGGGRCAYPCKR